MNGKYVERVYLSPSESVIFKPLTNTEQAGKEIYIYRHILPSFPPVYPKLLAHSPEQAGPECGWALFEDLGRLQHRFDPGTAERLLVCAASWHALPAGRWADAPLSGPKPSAGTIRSGMLEHERDWAAFQQSVPGLSPGMYGRLFTALREIDLDCVQASQVLSHGDLHLGNYALANGRLAILDWEHVHLNSRYWDLYHVLDLSHPLFPKSLGTAERERLLDGYIEAASRSGGPPLEPDFKRRYYLFSSLYSLWMLKLIAGDIERNNGIWPLDRLKSQLAETVQSFKDCLESV
ncbi:phosphotransferase [Paenibacillus sp. N4]|nr:phosphotransferase [Paenibacillus vietnamensis]